MNLHWQVRSERRQMTRRFPPICRQRAWQSSVWFTQSSLRHNFTFDQGDFDLCIAITPCFLHSTAAFINLWLQSRGWWAEVAENYSSISSWYDKKSLDWRRAHFLAIDGGAESAMVPKDLKAEHGSVYLIADSTGMWDPNNICFILGTF